MRKILSLLAFFTTLASYGQLAPPENVTASPSYLCPGSSATLSATVLSPNSVKWYTTPTGGTAFATTASGATTTVSPSVTTTYYAETSGPSGSQNFSHSGNGGIQTWVVPAGVTRITVDARGASGMNGTSPIVGGKGGRVVATLNVTEGTTLYISVGSQGAVAGGGFNGFNGANPTTARRGGGATDIRIGGTNATNRVLVAGGGGAASSVSNGGNGGNPATAGSIGLAGTIGGIPVGGGAATISAAGAGGAGATGGSSNGTAGTAAGLGGGGGTGTTPGGNGGGGYFGGGGGGSNSSNTNRSAGGGGGSSYVSPTYLVGSADFYPGDNTGDGRVVISWEGQTSATRVPITVNLVSQPTSVTVSDIANTTATLNWTSVAGVDNYEWKLVAAGAGSAATAIASGVVTALTVNLTNLTPATSYDAYVRSLCNGGGVSGWSNLANFTTTITYPPSVDFGELATPCNTTNKPTLILKYTNPQYSPDLYSITSDIPNFTDVTDANLDGSGEIAISLNGTTPVSGNLYTMTITVKNSTTSASTAYSKDITFYSIPTNIPAYNSVRQVFANVECLDGNYWTHYINTTTDELILSLSKGEWNPGALVTNTTPSVGEYSVNVGFSGTTGTKHINAPYVTATGGWYIMDKSFDVKTLVQPTTNSTVTVRYYYGDDMYEAVNDSIVLAGQLSDSIPGHESLTIYKLKTSDSYSKLQLGHASLVADDMDFYNNTFTNPNYHFTTGLLDGNSSVHYLEYSVNHFSGGGGGSAAGGAPPFIPVFDVQLANFNGYSTPSGNELAWQTLAETNNDKFEIEASQDGKDFVQVGIVKSLALNGNSTKTLNYKFKDNMASNHFYRLKQVDIDGKFNYSNTIEIAPAKTSLLYPNPAKDNLYLVYTKANEFSVQIFSLAGQCLMNLPISNDNFRQIDVRELPQGAYLLKVVDRQNRVIDNMMWTK